MNINFKGHLTHYRGQALKSLSHVELINALSQEVEAHSKTRTELLRLMAKRGGSDFYNTGVDK